MIHIKRNEPPSGGPAEPTVPAYLTKHQLAARLGVCLRTVDYLVAKQRIPFVRLSTRLIRFPVAEIDLYLQRHLTVTPRNVLPAPDGNETSGGGQ